ncbi:MAG: glycosyltransferase [Candidatus Melainabacteria bacterium]|nr:glycosyltransferase [Candidatus Melainabacteria bacterium]
MPCGSQNKIWLSVIVPVYKEPVGELKSLSAWIHANDEPDIEWIVVGAANDMTGLAALQELTESGARVGGGGVVTATQGRIQVIESWAGRSVQMNAGAARAHGQTLLFLHADTWLGAGWQRVLRNTIESESAAWGAFSPRIDARGGLFRLAEWWGQWRSQVLGLPYGDQALFANRELFVQVGGFDEVVQFMEEVDLSRRLHHLGFKPVIVAVEAITSVRKWSTHGIWDSVRNIVAFTLYLTGVPREWIERWYKGQ